MHETDQTNFIGDFLERQVHALGSLKSLQARAETDKAKSVQVDVKPSPREDKEADFSYLNLVGVRGFEPYPQCAEASGWLGVSIGWAPASRIQILGVN